jgi:hypothetical protein
MEDAKAEAQALVEAANDSVRGEVERIILSPAGNGDIGFQVWVVGEEYPEVGVIPA